MRGERRGREPQQRETKKNCERGNGTGKKKNKVLTKKQKEKKGKLNGRGPQKPGSYVRNAKNWETKKGKNKLIRSRTGTYLKEKKKRAAEKLKGRTHKTGANGGSEALIGHKGQGKKREEKGFINERAKDHVGGNK